LDLLTGSSPLHEVLIELRMVVGGWTVIPAPDAGVGLTVVELEWPERISNVYWAPSDTSHVHAAAVGVVASPGGGFVASCDTVIGKRPIGLLNRAGIAEVRPEEW